MMRRRLLILFVAILAFAHLHRPAAAADDGCAEDDYSKCGEVPPPVAPPPGGCGSPS